jgi:hypothetical protein
MSMADVEKGILERIRVWWRPVACIGIAGGVVIHGVVLPLWKQESLDLMGWAAVITACSTAFAVRTWEKLKQDDPNGRMEDNT